YRRRSFYPELKALKAKRGEAERAKGDHFRSKIFEKQPSPEDLKERERLSRELDEVIHQIVQAKHEQREQQRQQDALVRRESVRQLHERRRRLEVEAEFKRL